ncbi:dna polymerase delta small subunit [Nannochloropsis gaditana]|uniref:Dna polymerase delta small subunit n=1 Tax=Nannochloropsis gaditana TaxID=72520 RepID=W7U3L4_9STRA|nr:dna polymerase delta small subunit [Nannochloropsis gaditana]
MTSKQQEEFALPFKHVDLVLAQLASAVPVDVMPGADDPSNHTLPQQPIHPCILPHASRYTSFKTVPNPHEAWLQRRLFLGNAGQIPADLARSTAPPSLPSSPASSAARTLDLMEKTLHWRHLAPTAPDTLACYPFCDDDPFVLPSLPHVYFAGNQSAFAARLVEEGQEGGVEGKEGKKCLLVAVPSFAATGTVVLVNLNDLTATPLHFKGLPAQRQEREGKEGEGEEMEVEEGEGEEEN